MWNPASTSASPSDQNRAAWIAGQSTRTLLPRDCMAALPAIAMASSTHAWLGLCADKHALLSCDGQGLLLYAPRSSYAIALCEATGSRQGRAQVTHAFLDQCHAEQRQPVFYQVADSTAAAMRQDGWQTYALGEEARVALTQFSLDGGERKTIRQNVRKLEREGVRFELVARPDARLLRQCLDVSHCWLGSRRSSEKRFSLGQASAEYLACMPLAAVWQGERLVAFANVLQTADRSVLSVDLMRHRSDAPRGCMDFLFANLMLWGRAQGYAQFSLGMAPLTGPATTRGSRHWPQIVRLVRRFGERYYSFNGLRRYKQKWQPDWQPRYLVVPRRRDLLPALLECAVVIAGGKRRLLGIATGSAAKPLNPAAPATGTTPPAPHED